MLKRIMVLDSDYPGADNLYGDVFVHTRVKEYQKTAVVKVVSFFRDKKDYAYEGVSVVHAPQIQDVERIFKEFNPEYIFIHFYNRKLFGFISKVNIPVVIWVHGYEALGWYRRLFNYTLYGLLRNIHNIVLPNVKQMIGFRKLVEFSNKNNRVHFVFVSDWMRKVSQADSFSKIRNYSIIPNPINIDLFKYNLKTEQDRKRILMIRSFNSHKYANDLAVEAIKLLSGKPFFNDLQFCIYGKGKYFKTLTDPLKSFSNVSLNETFLANQEIPGVHKQYGLFLCPTRQDAQGVSMCEAMSSGLVPITSDCTAIPEFVEHLHSGLLSDNPQELADAIEKLYHDPSMFVRISKQASASIVEKCSITNIVTKELSVFNHI
jgi:glycosyltransferase involved in cell wall biosynthesis